MECGVCGRDLKSKIAVETGVGWRCARGHKITKDLGGQKRLNQKPNDELDKVAKVTKTQIKNDLQKLIEEPQNPPAEKIKDISDAQKEIESSKEILGLIEDHVKDLKKRELTVSEKEEVKSFATRLKKNAPLMKKVLADILGKKEMLQKIDILKDQKKIQADNFNSMKEPPNTYQLPDEMLKEVFDNQNFEQKELYSIATNPKVIDPRLLDLAFENGERNIKKQAILNPMSTQKIAAEVEKDPKLKHLLLRGGGATDIQKERVAKELGKEKAIQEASNAFKNAKENRCTEIKNEINKKMKGAAENKGKGLSTDEKGDILSAIFGKLTLQDCMAILKHSKDRVLERHVEKKHESESFFVTHSLKNKEKSGSIRDLFRKRKIKRKEETHNAIRNASVSNILSVANLEMDLIKNSANKNHTKKIKKQKANLLSNMRRDYRSELDLNQKAAA
jgi:hypothetical protein